MKNIIFFNKKQKELYKSERKNFIIMCICMIIISLLLINCTTLTFNKPTSVPEQVALYDAFHVKMKNTQANIIEECTVKIIITEEDCKKVKSYYNFAADIYVIAGEYLNVLTDPDNSEQYMINATTLITTLTDKESLAPQFVGIVNDLKTISDSEGIDKTERALILLEDKVLDLILKLTVKEN